MRIVYAHLCDYALFTQDGKPSYIGVFTHVRTTTLPAGPMSVYLAFGIVDIKPTDKFGIQVAVVAPDGKQILEIGGEMQVTGVLEGKGAIAHQILKMPLFPILQHGAHEIRILLGASGSPSFTTYFDVTPRQEQGA